jgi:hypothetical protein
MLLILGRMTGPMEAKAKPPGIWGYINLYTEHSQGGEEECHHTLRGKMGSKNLSTAGTMTLGNLNHMVSSPQNNRLFILFRLLLPAMRGGLMGLVAVAMSMCSNRGERSRPVNQAGERHEREGELATDRLECEQVNQSKRIYNRKEGKASWKAEQSEGIREWSVLSPGSPEGWWKRYEGIKNKMEQGQKREGQAEPLSHLEDCPVPGMVGYDSNVSPSATDCCTMYSMNIGPAWAIAGSPG